jgi:hypothetical protein
MVQEWKCRSVEMRKEEGRKEEGKRKMASEVQIEGLVGKQEQAGVPRRQRKA